MFHERTVLTALFDSKSSATRFTYRHIVILFEDNSSYVRYVSEDENTELVQFNTIVICYEDDDTYKIIFKYEDDVCKITYFSAEGYEAFIDKLFLCKNVSVDNSAINTFAKITTYGVIFFRYKNMDTDKDANAIEPAYIQKYDDRYEYRICNASKLITFYDTAARKIFISVFHDCLFITSDKLLNEEFSTISATVNNDSDTTAISFGKHDFVISNDAYREFLEAIFVRRNSPARFYSKNGKQLTLAASKKRIDKIMKCKKQCVFRF